MHISRSFLLLLASLSLSMSCYASPLPESSKPSPETRTWGRRDEPHRVHLGYRYVKRKSVLIYASAGRELAKAAGKVVQAKPKGDEAKWVIEGTLTNIRATGTLLGEGAYLTPNLGGWQGDFVCEVWADLEKFKETPKFLAKEESEYLPFDDKAWDRMLSKHDKTMSQNTTIIAARIPGQYRYTMRIPPHYLKPSPQRMMDILTGRKKPKVDLGITVRCVSEKQTSSVYP
ncbi:hypothetical protein C8J55DRAFT_160881 [Lentinula edodes]|uniref:Uncharacterized protein n=1 Tax=Lentinula lateritia TaxID=40482 RepID=A0A9W9B075_9AGAR|nr:hypothetical protein C8J55DRAFT_160881 [Lentinula edodes]